MVKRAKRITFFKEDRWPPAAPRPRALLDRAGAVIERVNRTLNERGSQRVVATCVIHANRRLGISVKGDVEARYTLRMHWALFSVPELHAAITQAVLTGRFPASIEHAFTELRPQLTHEHVYADQALDDEDAAAGDFYDLEDLLRSVSTFLPPELSAEGVRILWGKRNSTPNKRTIRLGSMDERKALIRIHPVLDSALAPRFVVEFVVWHELCHYVAPPLAPSRRDSESKRRIHHDEFLALEGRYPHFQEAERWIRQNIDALLQGELSASSLR